MTSEIIGVGATPKFEVSGVSLPTPTQRIHLLTRQPPHAPPQEKSFYLCNIPVIKIHKD